MPIIVFQMAKLRMKIDYKDDDEDDDDNDDDGDDDDDDDDSRAGHRLPARHRRRRHLRRLHLLLGHRRDQGSHVDGHVPSRLHVRLFPRDHHQGQLRCWGRFDCLRHQLSIRTS